MGEDYTLYRGEDGAAHVVAPRCAHRGTQLSTGWVEADCLRCFYHGWKYDSTGQCVEMPAEDPSFPPRVKIRGYPTEEYLGLVFAFLGEGGAHHSPRYRSKRTTGCSRYTTTPGRVATSTPPRTSAIRCTSPSFTARRSSPSTVCGVWFRPWAMKPTTAW